MESFTYSCPTKNKNTYLIEQHKSLICYLHPLVEKGIKGENISDEYYREKYEYLRKYILQQGEYITPNQMRISVKTIKNKVANLSQLVFEVTDACNLKCKYCIYGDIYEEYGKRENKKLRMQQVKPLFDYLLDLEK